MVLFLLSSLMLKEKKVKRSVMAGCGMMMLCGYGGTAPLDSSVCMRISKAVSDTQLAMAGIGSLEKPRKDLLKLSEQAPEMEQEINALVEVSRDSESAKLGAPAHPMSTGKYDEVEQGYKMAYQKLCE